jgi:creatinine amidohydrolase
VVAPTLTIGVSEHWMDHPGTLTLTPATFVEVVFEVCESLRRAGIGSILLLNGHGGNRRPIECNLAQLRQRLGMRLEFHSYWEAYPPEMVSRLLVTGECPGHAGEFETSTALALFPQLVHDTDEPYPAGEIHIRDERRAEDDRRFFEGAKHASRETGQEFLRVAVDWVEVKLRELLR